MKRLRILLWIVMVLAVLAVGTVLVLTQLVDPNEYKPQIARIVAEKTGRDLDLQGDLQLTFFPWLGVETGKLSLANAPGFGETPMVSVENARVQAKLLPLLKRRLEVDTVVLDRPVVHLQVDASGKTNWEDLISQAGASSEPEDAGGTAIAGLAVQGVSIVDGRVNWRNLANGQDLALTDLDLSTGRLVPGEPLELALSLDAEGNPLPVSGRMELQTTVTLSDNLQSVTLAETSLQLAAAEDRITVEIARLSHALAAGLTVVNGLTAVARYQDVESRLSVPSLSLDPSDQTLEIPGLALEQGGASLEASLRAAGLASPDLSGRIRWQVDDLPDLLARNGVAGIELPAKLTDIDGGAGFAFRQQRLRLADLSLAAAVNDQPTRLDVSEFVYRLDDGTIEIPELALEQAGASLEASLRAAGLASPDLSGRIRWQVDDLPGLLARNGVAGIELPAKLTDIDGGAGFAFRQQRLSLADFSLAVAVNDQPTRLDVSGIDYHLADETFSLQALQLTQGDFRLAGSLQGEKLLSDPAARRLDGNLDLAMADVTELVSRNGLEVAVPELPIRDITANSELVLQGSILTATSLNLTAAHHGQATSFSAPALEFDVAGGDLDLGEFELTQDDFRLRGAVRGSGLLEGIADIRANGRLEVAAGDLADLLVRNALVQSLPPGVPNTLDAQFGFDLAENALDLEELQAGMDDMTVTGRVALSDLADPGYRFDLAINRLDLDAMFPLEEDEPASEKPTTAEQLLLPVAPLQGLDVKGRARVGELVTTGITLQDVDLTVDSTDNVLRVSPLTARLFGGEAETHLAYDVSAGAPALSLQASTSALDVGALLAALGVTEKVEGTGNLDVDLTGQGEDLDRLVGSLSGDIGFLLRNGALRGFDLQATLLKLESEIARYRGKASEARPAPGAETRFAELSGSFRATKGTFVNEDFAMKAPAFRVGGGGVIDLPKDRIDYKLDVNVVDTVEGQGGKALAELRGARIPLKIYGPLAEPSFTLDLASLLEERAKEEVKKKILEELGVETDDGSATGTTGDRDSGGGTDTMSGDPQQPAAQSSGQSAEQAPPKDPKKALEDELKKKLTEGLLKGLGF